MITSGKKTAEVRKSRPKLETPFKCYIYCTNKPPYLAWGDVFRGNWETEFTHISGYSREKAEKIWDVFNGKVIGEFICDRVLDVFISCSDPNMMGYPFPGTGLTDREIMDYLGNGRTGYGWHISDLVIYDEPKELSEFYTYDRAYENSMAWAFTEEEKRKPITRPPQSWCYVEEWDFQN